MQQSFFFDNEINIYDKDNFIIHDGNRIVYEILTSGSLYNNNVFLLTGKKGSGKTYMCNIWKNIKTNKEKFVLEDIENTKMSEEDLLHFINNTNHGILLITSCRKLNDFNFILPDLQSRFRNFYNIKLLDINNDEIKKQILLKLLNDKQLKLSDNNIDCIVEKISANYETIIDFVNKLNECKKIDKEQIKGLL
ncbi:MAG: hypothetical protein LBT02_02175 [Rickettsiales bacterium]|jgi:chromosomal replication initiation ATPase DnaA|nr:hypothetical protein [Rickettsiales bacterium]